MVCAPGVHLVAGKVTPCWRSRAQCCAICTHAVRRSAEAVQTRTGLVFGLLLFS